MADMTVAKTILEQLGGRRFTVMTGAKHFVGSANSLSFQLPGRSGYTKKGINAVTVTLDERDTYTVEFVRIRKFQRQVISIKSGVYFDQLAAVFREETGLETRLGGVTA